MGEQAVKTLEMLQRETDAAIEAIAAIKDQIARAKSRAANTGDYSDADWFLNANRALRYKQRDHQRLLREAAQVRAEIKKANHAESLDRAVLFERNFMKAAKQLLDEPTYLTLISEARIATDRQ